jgi:hypothetical protein
MPNFLTIQLLFNTVGRLVEGDASLDYEKLLQKVLHLW